MGVPLKSDLLGVRLDYGTHRSAARFMEHWLPDFREHFPIEVNNGGYMACDAHMLWALVRGVKPKQVIEIGSGYSTQIMAKALSLNGYGELTSIDPNRKMKEADAAIQARAEDLPIEAYTDLRDGDILFIDSSHEVALGNDVHFLYFEVLPRLKPGVLVHVHDVYFPYDCRSYYQTSEWWAEQLVLQALLSNSDRWGVLWCGSFVWHMWQDLLKPIQIEMMEMKGHYPKAVPSALWMSNSHFPLVEYE